MRVSAFALVLALVSTTAFADMLDDRGYVKWNLDSRNYLGCSKTNILVRVMCEPVELAGNFAGRLPFNVVEETLFGVRDGAQAAGDVVPVLGHILGAAVGMGIGALKGIAEGIAFSPPAVLEKPEIVGY